MAGELEEPLGERALPVSLTGAEALIPRRPTGGRGRRCSRRRWRGRRASVEARRALGELLLATGPLDSVRDQYREVLRRLGEPLARLPLRELSRAVPHLRLPLSRLRGLGRAVA